VYYLGGLCGAGILTCGDRTVARVDYDFEGFLTRPGQVTGCGEVRMSPEILRKVFGRKDLQLLTDDGRTLTLRFSGKRLDPMSDAAHVDITGGLPLVSEWHH
jgi:hypothetical protein